MRERQSYRNRLDNLISQIPTLSSDLYLQSNLVKFACVLVCGYVEVSLRDVLQEYTRKRASVEVGKYANRQLERIRNPKMEVILELMGAFSQDWKKSMESETQGRLKLHVDSLVNDRNLIAHGKDVGLSYVQLQGYYRSALAVIELIEKHCNAG